MCESLGVAAAFGQQQFAAPVATTGEQALVYVGAYHLAGGADPAPLADRQHPDVIAFNVVPPLRLRGRAAVAEQTHAWFDAYAGDIGYEVRERTGRARPTPPLPLPSTSSPGEPRYWSSSVAIPRQEARRTLAWV